MTFELRSNGGVEIEMTPETVIECAFVEAFLLAGERGRTVRISRAGEGPAALVVSVEK